MAVPPPGHLPRARRAGSLDLAVVAAAMIGACAGLPLVERGAGAGLHGRRRLARARRRDGRAGAAHQHRSCCCRSSAASTCSRRCSVIAQVDLVPRLPPAGAAHGADPPPLRGRRLARVHGHRAVLAVRRRCCVALGARHLLRRLHPHPGGRSTDARPRDRARGHGRRRGRVRRSPPQATTSSCSRTEPGGDGVPTSGAAARDGRGRERASRRPTRRSWPRVARRPTSWSRARACDPTIPRSSPRTVAGRAGAVRGRRRGRAAASRTPVPRSSRSPARTARRRSPR